VPAWVKKFDTHIRLYVAAALALIAGVSNLVQNSALTVATFVLFVGGVVWLLVGIAEKADRIGESIDRIGSEIGRTTPLPNADAVYSTGRKLLETDEWAAVYIWAPVGLWFPSEPKDRWIAALRSAFENGDVGRVAGVFGGPPVSSKADLVRAIERLCLLAGVKTGDLTPSASSGASRECGRQPDDRYLDLHYLPPPDHAHPTPAPGLGSILFKHKDYTKSVVLHAFTAERTGLNTGVVLRQAESNAAMIEWFEKQMLWTAGSFVIQGTDYRNDTDVTFADGVADFLSFYPDSNGWRRQQRLRRP
jgi:hypothetical protein